MTIITLRALVALAVYSKKCLTDSSALPHLHYGVSDVPVRKMSLFSIVSCSNIREYPVPVFLILKNMTLSSNRWYQLSSC